MFITALCTGNSIASHFKLIPVTELYRTARRTGRRQLAELLLEGEEVEDE